MLFVMETGAVADLRGARLLEPQGFGRSFKRGTGGDHPPAIEAHLGGRYYAVTGDRLADMPVALRTVPTATLARLLGEIGPAFRCGEGGEARPDRSAQAFRLAGRIRREGGDFAAFCAALDRDPDTAAWRREKGTERELRRAWERADGAAAPAAWGAPDMSLLHREPIPPPDWPRDLFPPYWGNFIDEAADARGAPPDFAGLAVLAAVAARIGNARWGCPWGDWREPSTLWAAAVGLPSSGKSPGLDVAAEPLSALEAEANHDWEERCRAFRTRREEAKAIRDRWLSDVKAAVANGAAPPHEPLGAREPDPPARRRVMSTDPTIEKAGRLAADNPRGLLLLRDELAGWLGGMDRYGGAGADRAFWLQSHGGRRWQPDRVKDGDRGVEVPHLSWNIIGGIQPDRLASLLLAGDDDGLASRFLYAWPAARMPRRPHHAPPGGRLLVALRRLDALPWTPPEPVALPFSADAADAMQAWREEAAAMEADAAGLFLTWIGKLPGFALRLAVVFAHLEWLAREGGAPPAEVNGDAMARACGFLSEYAVPMARRVFGAAALPEAERDARRLARWFMRQSPRPAVVNGRELRRMSDGPGIPTAERTEVALAELAEAGWCRPAPGRAGEAAGRPRKDWAMNPALMTEPAP